MEEDWITRKHAENYNLPVAPWSSRPMSLWLLEFQWQQCGPRHPKRFLLCSRESGVAVPRVCHWATPKHIVRSFSPVCFHTWWKILPLISEVLLPMTVMVPWYLKMNVCYTEQNIWRSVKTHTVTISIALPLPSAWFWGKCWDIPGQGLKTREFEMPFCWSAYRDQLCHDGYLVKRLVHIFQGGSRRNIGLESA